MTFEIKSEDELSQVVEYLKPKLKENIVVSLEGNLGAGKTTLVKKIAKALNIKDDITSPTFNIIKEYDNRLCHIDAYRIMQEDIGLDHYLNTGYITFIEWASNISDYIDEFDYTIKIDYTLDGRKITIME